MKQKFVCLGKASYVSARHLAASKGLRLISNVLHDDFLLELNRLRPTDRGDAWRYNFYGTYSRRVSKEQARRQQVFFKEVFDKYYVRSAWAREIVVFPAEGSQFKKGEDIVDVHWGGVTTQGCDVKQHTTLWVFAGSNIPEQAIGKNKVGLFVDPEDVLIENYKGKTSAIVQPKSIIVVEGLVDSLVRFSDGQSRCGQVHEQTRLPIEVPPEVWKALPDEQKRWFFRPTGAGVRLLERNCINWESIHADHDHYEGPEHWARRFSGAIAEPIEKSKVEK